MQVNRLAQAAGNFIDTVETLIVKSELLMCMSQFDTEHVVKVDERVL